MEGVIQNWPHQITGPADVEAAVAAGAQTILLTSPTGMGKTHMVVSNIAVRWAELGKRVVFVTNRRLLTGQAARAIEAAGVGYGVVAAGYDLDDRMPITVLSIQTADSRVFKRESMELPPADLVIIDEAHSNKAGVARQLMVEYLERGAVILGITATPVGLGKIYQDLIVAGTVSSGRRCGALVPCDVFAPDEPDMRGVKKVKGEYVQDGMAKRVMETIVFANVFEHWRKLNPAQHPTLLWAPGVAESVWFKDEFVRRGVTAEHIDGSTPESERTRIIDGSRSGSVRVVCSCGVLREGVDLPWIQHGILVQACGALSTYLQLVGRLLRSYPGKTRAILQDHSGAWHRQGSPNIDRTWSLQDTDVKLAQKRTQDLKEGRVEEGVRCPVCSMIRKVGPKCPFCGHEHVRSVRVVRMLDGTLKKMVGSVTKKRRDRQTWTQCLYACGLSGKTVGQAAGFFARKTGKALPKEFYPPEPADWARKVTSVYPWISRRRTS